jgi:signal recognition particle receptor subunit beta
MQFNKRDLAEEGIPLMPVEQMAHDLNRQLKVPTFQASAVKGEGVAKTLHACLKLTLLSLKKELSWND